MPSDSGDIAGLFCANTDDTDGIISERRLQTIQDLSNLEAKHKSIDEVYRAAARALEKNNKDFPFAIIYKIDADGKSASPIAHAAIAENQTVFPIFIDLQNPKEGMLNLYKALRQKEVVISENNGRRKNLPKGTWET